MLRKTIILGICIGSSASVPLLYQSNSELIHAMVRAAPVEPAETLPLAGATPAAAAKPGALSGRKVAIGADARGHYQGDFRINGRTVEALVDTGATTVAFNMSTARRLGLKVRPADMTHSVSTANGKARATVVMVDRIEIGRISVNDVQALVLEDDALNTVLIGMTFLNRLKSFQVDQGTLQLVQ